MEPLVSTEWLAKELGATDLRVIDASWHLPDAGRHPRSEFEAGHIPGAVFFDIDEIADTSSPYPAMLPSPEKFASRMQALGLGDGCRVVIYDNSDTRTASRAWWMLQVFGQHDTAVLDGGFQKWTKEGRPVESGKPQVRHRHFTVWQDKRLVRDLDQMKANLVSKAEQVIDSRSPGRFTGAEPDPRPGLRQGHIPGARNVHYASLFNEDGTYKRGDALRQAFEAAGVDLGRGIVASCGAGISACSIAFGLHLLGKKDVAVYDGSWSEWGSLPDTPVVSGPA